MYSHHRALPCVSSIVLFVALKGLHPLAQGNALCIINRIIRCPERASSNNLGTKNQELRTRNSPVYTCSLQPVTNYFIFCINVGQGISFSLLLRPPVDMLIPSLYFNATSCVPPEMGPSSETVKS